MSDLEPRRGRLPRRAREQRAYNLVVTGSVASVVFVVGLVLSIVGVVGAWLPILALIIAVGCGVLFRRAVS